MESIIHLLCIVKEVIRRRVGIEYGAPPLKAGKEELRRRNTLLLLALVQSDGPSSQADLARRSGLSPATVSGILQPLIESRILIEEGKSTSGLGRRASILAFNSRANLTAGISIDLEEVEVALVDLSGRVLDQTATRYPRYTEPNEVVTLAAEGLALLEKRNSLDRSSIAGAGVAIPGLINSATGVVQVASNLGWMNVQLRDLFEQRLGVSARVEHLGRAKARAEAIWGKGKNHRNFVCLEIGSGIGAGVVVHGRILRGAGGIGGEVGHMPIDPAGPTCACGFKGCWEVFCSGPAIRRNLARRLEGADDSRGALSPIATLGDLEAAYQQGNAIAVEVVEEAADYLVRGLVGVIWSFDPEFVLLTGPVVNQCPSLVEAAKRRMGAMQGNARSFDVPLILESHHAGTGVVAASAAIATRYLEELAFNGIPKQNHVLTA
ncbi:MAG: ROK family transcriptional regulator [Bryobacterales bacterium]|nr:ROK family transcriptional regulator [Bryobacterales bacterium]